MKKMKMLSIILLILMASVLFSNPILANEQFELEDTVEEIVELYESVDDVKEDFEFIDYDEELDFEWDVIDISNMKDQAIDSEEYNYFGADGKYVDNTGTKMISEALKYLGNPYVFGGNSLTNGTDCSGYVYLIHQMYCISTPRTASLQYAAANSISSSNLQPGDLVFYCNNGVDIGHVAFYAGTINGTSDSIVHAPNPSQGITLSTRTYWSVPKKYATFWR